MKYAAILLISLFIGTPQLVCAQDATSFSQPIIVVRESGALVYSQNGDVVWPIASITKLMSAMVLLDARLSWHTPVTLAHSDEVGGARLRVRVGQRYRRIDLLYAALMGSANNAIHALARTSGLTPKNFVARMNAKARALGMTHTTFVDPTGIDPRNISTASDIARMVEAARTYTTIARIAQTKTYSLVSVARRPVPHTIKNTNELLAQGAPIAIGKTGYLVESRYNFAMIARADTGRERTVVVFNAPSMAASFHIAREFGNLAQ